MKQISLFLCIWFPLFTPTVAQTPNIVDTLSIVRFANIQILAAQNLSFNEPELIAEMAVSLPVDYRLLESKGFVNVLFFKIKSVPRMDTIRNAKDSSFEKRVIINPVEQEYVFAFNFVNKTLYRISGFKESDFDLFFETFRDIKDPILGLKAFNSSRKIRQNFYIESVDIACHYRNMKSLRGRSKPCSKTERRIF